MPENCMILKKSWGQGRPGPQGLLDPLVSGLHVRPVDGAGRNRHREGVFIRCTYRRVEGTVGALGT